MRLWLDDVRRPPRDEGDAWHWCKTASGARDAVEKFGPDISEMSLDHDLDFDLDKCCNIIGGETGYDFLVWLLETEWRGTIRIHSMNPVGRKRMTEAIVAKWGVWERGHDATNEA